ncbi:MAG: hypothetical protein ABMB14_07955 [Myxococcota bacterium]
MSRIDVRVLDDGFPLTQLRIDITRLLRGSVSTGRITLVLPGARLEGNWNGFAGIPEAAVGDELLWFGQPMSDTEVVMTGGPQSVFKLVRGTDREVAADFFGNPVLDPGCTADRLIARPETEAPRCDASTTVDYAVPLDRVFVPDPLSVGLDWARFVDDVAACVASQPTVDAALSDIGGGW